MNSYGNLRVPTQCHPTPKRALYRLVKGQLAVNNPLIRPYFLGGVGSGWVPLDSHVGNPFARGKDVDAQEATR